MNCDTEHKQHINVMYIEIITNKVSKYFKIL